ncbi:hypothetical protein vBAspPH44_25 [Alteromonas phage vB_AspP-H4/4]|uniref:Uncharacterized protein n=1 Tax=Alteromonas phage vB_AspP-H4/4 TaxID=2928692 RepID=A0A220YL60_9CAUD|nr:hypothetical protein HOR85_gp25 [Alteromonas phage vB_AspP-H4/4]ASL24408.1 hypothetical protein vBAspPH44_25 [Alteromonas phage vB_AspP-H4/4]
MQVFIPVNELVDGEESVTVMRIDFGDVTERVAKRKMRVILDEWNIPRKYHKKLMKEYFPNDQNGKASNAEH